jgi:hypothetical protein
MYDGDTYMEASKKSSKTSNTSMINLDHYTPTAQSIDTFPNTDTNTMVQCMELLNELKDEISIETFMKAVNAFKAKHLQISFIMMDQDPQLFLQNCQPIFLRILAIG